MKNPRLLATSSLIIALLLLLLTASDFLALTDIHHDYVSSRVFEVLRIPPPAGLPDWTATEGEWLAVAISVYSKGALLVLITLTLALCVKALGAVGVSRSSDSEGVRRDHAEA